jgi:hypothetical protein
VRQTLRLGARALGARVVIPWLLWTLPLDRVLQVLTPASPDDRARPDTLPAIESVTDTLTRRLLPTRTACLKRALLRYALLRREGHDADFVIGVRPGGEDGFEAHAWVTLAGKPIMEQETVDYRPTFVWPVAA